MDFIEQLPPSSSFTTILVVVDDLPKQGIFIPTINTIDSEQLMLLFIMHIYSKHGVPNHVTSDHSTGFVSCFTHALSKVLNMYLHSTSRYHPQADSQTKCTNQTLKQYLQMYCNYHQSDWSTLFPLTEFSYNSTPSTTTSVSPFFGNKGYHLNITVNAEHELASTQACEFVLDLDALHQTLQQSIIITQEYQHHYANDHHITMPEFLLGSEAYVHTEYFHVTHPSKKLLDKMAGPFEVIAYPGSHSYTLCLPKNMCLIHPVFHITMLEPAVFNIIPGCIQSPPPPETINGKEH